MKKSIKIINWVNLALAVFAVILEAFPNSIKLGRYASRGGKIVVLYSFTSYFSSPKLWGHPFLLIAIIAAFLTIFSLLIFLISCIKGGKGLSIFAVIVTALAFLVNLFLTIACGVDSTAFNILVLIIQFTQLVLSSINLSWINKSKLVMAEAAE